MGVSVWLVGACGCLLGLACAAVLLEPCVHHLSVHVQGGGGVLRSAEVVENVTAGYGDICWHHHETC